MTPEPIHPTAPVSAPAPALETEPSPQVCGHAERTGRAGGLSRILRGLTASAGVAALIAATPGLADLGAAAAPAAVTGPIVTEIQGDNTGDDNFEYIELYNPLEVAVDFAADGFSLGYDNDGTIKTLTTANMDGTEGSPNLVLQPGATVVLWLSYNDGKRVDSFAKTEQEFREAISLNDSTVPVVRLTGQGGIANGGERGVVVQKNGQTLAESYLPAIDPKTPGTSTHFALPISQTDKHLSVWQQSTAPTPGVVDEAQLANSDSDDNGSDDGTGGTDPETPVDTDPTPGFDPVADPSATGAPLQITELLPDSSNVGGSDGYEFIEVYNSSSAAVDFADYVLTYLIPIDYDNNTTETLWPSTKRDVVIQPGATLVFWVKNSANQQLTVDDFNTKFGTALVDGETIVEVQSSGMANGAMRGVALRTNTGYTVSRAYYNMSVGQGTKDTVADQGLHYTAGTDTDRPEVQRILETSAATPGQVSQQQVGESLIVAPTDTTSPVIENRTIASTDGTGDLTISAHITDNQQVRTVELTYRNNVDNTDRTLQLKRGSGDVYSTTIASGDLAGKSTISYRFTATDGVSTLAEESGTVTIERDDAGPVQLNVTEGQIVAGSLDIVASGDAGGTTVDVDGQTQQTSPSLPSQPTFLFEATNTDVFFRNGVKVALGENKYDVLNIFDDGTYSNTVTISTPVPLSYLTKGSPVKLSIWAGTKAWPDIDENENNDDFEVKNLRLVLPDGRTLRSTEWADADQVIQMGDSTGKHDYIEGTFTLDDDDFSGVGFTWNTATVADGMHTITARSGDETLTRKVLVDNTAPTVSPSVTSDAESEHGLHGAITLDASVGDGDGDVSGVPDGAVSATLDGQSIGLPYVTSSTDLAAGQHTLSVTATDAAGNTSTETRTFTTIDETPSVAELSVGSTATMNADGTATVDLQATATDPTGGSLTVDFNEGSAEQLGDGVQVATGTTNDAAATDRSSAVALSADDLARLSAADGQGVTTTGTDGLPYQLFTVTVPEGVTSGQVRANWTGSSNPNAQVTLFALRSDGSAWDQVDRHYTPADDTGANFDLSGYVDVASHAKDGVVTLVVQHSDGWSGADTTTRDSDVEAYNADATDRSDYDFTLAWESDTQYYNENLTQNFRYQQDIHQFLLDQRKNLNLKYMFHTGDIVDDFDQEYEWQNADEAYSMLEKDVDGNPLAYEDRIPYGVLAGNHDVGHKSDDYSAYSTWFGSDRFSGSPWFGGDYKDNQGHYDLFSAGGIDFMVVSIGWGPGDEEIAWMNQVISEHPERTVILNLHEFMLTTGGLGPIPQRIMDEVVATNSNVSMVFSGHYHDAYTRQDSFDDDGDGVNDRVVTSMLFDYQGLEQGGLGYLRLLHFDNESQTMRVRTYSPSLDDFDAEEPSLADTNGDLSTYQDFAISYADLGIQPQTKTLTTDSFSASVLSNRGVSTFSRMLSTSGAIASVTTPSGVTASTQWTVPGPGVYGWYAEVTGQYGAQLVSPVMTFTVRSDGSVVEGVADPQADDTTSGEGSNTATNGGSGTGDSGISADTGAQTEPALAATGADRALLGAGILTLMLGGMLRLLTRRRVR